MLQQFSRASALTALVTVNLPHLPAVFDVIRPTLAALGRSTLDLAQSSLGIVDARKPLKYTKWLSGPIYTLLRDLVTFLDSTCWQSSLLSIPLNKSTPSLSARAHLHSTLHWKRDRNLATEVSHQGNSLVSFVDPVTKSTHFGSIISIFTHRRQSPTFDSVDTFFVINRYMDLSEEDRSLSPFVAFPHLGIRLQYAFDADSAHHTLSICRLADLRCHLAAFKCEPSAFQIQQPVMVLVSLKDG